MQIVDLVFVSFHLSTCSLDFEITVFIIIIIILVYNSVFTVMSDIYALYYLDLTTFDWCETSCILYGLAMKCKKN